MRPPQWQDLALSKSILQLPRLGPQEECQLLTAAVERCLVASFKTASHVAHSHIHVHVLLVSDPGTRLEAADR